MKWRIKNPAPLDSRLEKWGDYHFGRSLGKYLTRLGEEVASDYDPEWVSDERCDVVLVLRGKYALPAEARHPGALHVIWNLSHPAAVTDEEYRSYDLVLVASATLAEELGRRRLGPPVHPFLQCTDTGEFFEGRSLGADRRDLVFVGNTRGERRDGVLWAIEEGFPLKIWGRGWEGRIPPHHVVADYVPNQDLGELYARARVTINDHWPDMREAGFINNRVFDALACGLPVVSDRHAELERLFPDAVLYYSTREELVARLEECLLSWSRVASAVPAATERVRRDFTFSARAVELRDLVYAQLGRPRPARTREIPSIAAAALPSIPEPEENRRWCPACERVVDGFRAFGIGKRPDAQCPNCGALERHRSAWLFLKHATDLCDGRPKRVLHPSPERHIGGILRRLPGVRSIGSDIVPAGVDLALDLTRAGLRSESFHAIYCSHVLEHIEDDRGAMAELYRLLEPGGWAVVMTPIRGDVTYEDPSVETPEERLARFGQSDHVRIYGRDIRDRLSEAGFEVVEQRGDFDFPETYRRFLSLKTTYLYYCRRPL